MKVLSKTVRRRRSMAFLAGMAVLIGLLIIQLSFIDRLATALREQGFRVVQSLLPRQAPADLPVIVVDIDRDALARFGPWPWPRDRLASLVSAIAEQAPAVVGLDMILLQRDSPEADAALVSALRRTPTFLGAALDPDLPTSERFEPLTIAVLGQANTSQLPEGQGLVTSPKHLLEAAAGTALISFISDDLGSQTIASVPLVALVQGKAVAGMPLALAKHRARAAAVIVDGDTGEVRIGSRSVPLHPDLSMRLHHGSPAGRRARTVTALSLLDGTNGAQLRGRIVLVGTSAPEIGGLRPTAVDPLMPSVQILADATEQLVRGEAPRRQDSAWVMESAVGVSFAVLGSLAVLLSPPLAAASLALGLGLTWIALAVMAFALKGLLLDLFTPLLVGLIPVQATALMLFSITARERRAIERRFAQHLPPEVVARIAEDPDRLRIDGEEREITALFTDIEGFTAMTERAEARDLIALLDSYVETVAGIVTAHGGMVDKIVGDAVHAFFNAPLDCNDHPQKALACAETILVATSVLRASPLGSKLALGRTRIGIETGRAILGDVGGGRKLDYTAHGPAINAAAKLEAANKEFGTQVLIGPGTAAKLGEGKLAPVATWKATPGSAPATIYTLRQEAQRSSARND